MRKPITSDLQFDATNDHVQYAIDATEKKLLRAALEFARHNLATFMEKYQEDIDFGRPDTARNELEELSQTVRDTQYFLLLPLESEREARTKTK